jgi:hypothetical protein
MRYSVMANFLYRVHQQSMIKSLILLVSPMGFEPVLSP